MIETLADKIADKCLEDHKISKVKVRVEKPTALKFAEGAGVEVLKHA
ncbi:MAG: dihydroneopterin aldolase [Nitrososphaeria archaeon]